MRSNMALAFFISCTGDTDLAIAAIAELKKIDTTQKIFLIPLSTTAINQTLNISHDAMLIRITLAEITHNQDISQVNSISHEDLKTVNHFLISNNIDHIYLGVPSLDNEIPFQIALHCNIPHTIIYEFMFKPQNHVLWKYTSRLTANYNCRFAVTLNSAAADIRQYNPNIDIHEIGHLSIDKALTDNNNIAETEIKNKLAVNASEELVFIAGSTQSIAVDSNFIDALLSELATGQHPDLQLRFGIHPGIENIDDYLLAIMSVCEQYPQTKDQFKIILPKDLRINTPLETGFIVLADVTGPMAAQAASKIAQAVPGTLLNEAVLQGKPGFFYDKSVKPYLPAYWFTTDIAMFLTQHQQPARTREALGLTDVTAAVALASLPNNEFT
jgi:hypothetical protein